MRNVSVLAKPLAGVVVLLLVPLAFYAGKHSFECYPPTMNSFTILIASDPHDDVESIHQLHLELQSRGVTPDLVLCPGDLTTMPSKMGVRPSPETLEEYNQRATSVLSALESINSKLYWIPGNHDPDTMFTPEDPIPIGTNVHAQVLEVAPELYVAGWGGSVAATQDGEPSWGGYPYSDDQIEPMVSSLRDEISSVPDGATVLLMTHCGPLGSSTAAVSGLNPNSVLVQGVREHWISSGSAALRSLVESEVIQSKCVLNVHGHTHNGLGVARIGSVTILNPGSTKHTRSYGLVKLLQNDSGLWRRSSVEVIEMID